MKVLGIDLGTNSIGLSVRNIDRETALQGQLEYFASIVFKSGIGKGQTGEYSYAAERTKHRSSRRLYQARRYRIWTTLELLINNGYCPLSIEDLNKWRKYDKKKGLKRQYPVEAKKFEQWVRLDFDGDGKSDYSSPYQLRAELMEKQFDFNKETDKYKLGRALYHIAQRRGFKSSKGETMKEQEATEIDFSNETEIDVTTELKKSEEKKSKDLKIYIEANRLKTVGCAFAKLEKEGIRIRGSQYQAVRSQYKDEIREIFDFQEGLDKNSELYKRLMSEKKGEGTIFYKRPLRSQKGLVGKCTLEKNKPRCPISHPEFEKFRAWCFINNIQYRKSTNDDWQNLTLDKKQKLYKDKFLRTAKNFKFQEIREWVEKEIEEDTHSYVLEHNQEKEKSTINYSDKTNVSGCPISGRLKNLLGENWEIIELQKEREYNGNKYKVTYKTEDIWHIAFSFDEAEFVSEFAKHTLGFDQTKADALVRLHNDIQQGYSMLSLKAIRNINRFLEEGLIYTEAVLLAKLPDIFGEAKWEENSSDVVSKISEIISENRKEKEIKNIANSLIANYKSLDETEQFAHKQYDYTLDEDDRKDIEKACCNKYGEKTWEKKNEEEKQLIMEEVARLYQSFFNSEKRDYYVLPKLANSLSSFLSENFHFLDAKNLQKIYHPSMIESYAPAKPQKIEDNRELKLLGSPVIGAIKNPMAMRVLHTLRKQINSLLKTVDEENNPLIDENTRIVVETSRDINDANMRWAIKTYQDERNAENEIYRKAIEELRNGVSATDDNIDKVRLLCDQYDIPSDEPLTSGYDDPNNEVFELKEITRDIYKKKDERKKAEEKLLKKYRLWLEQGCRCIYTGKLINIHSLFDDNVSDFEHTIPRSKSFDNSLANLTICDAHYNRTIKKNRIPTELENYDKDTANYTAILPRLKPWFDKVERLKNNVEFWKGQSKLATDKERKDHCIRQRHLWQMELNYWQNKLNRFTMEEVTDSFKNSQLVDTRIISKYAYHYLKTVFNRVEVQNGKHTSDYRRMLGIQDIEKKKDRSKHSHHAIDATVLTLIPTSAKRDKMLEIFYQIEEIKSLINYANVEEKEKLESQVKELQSDLRQEITQCGFGNKANEIGKFIEDNILINHVSKDQTLVPARKRWRVRGKVVWQRDESNKIVYKDRVPQPKRWITGDSIRGQLHKDSFFGAITQGLRDEQGRLLKNEDGSIKTDGKIYYVKRKELKFKKSKQDSGFKDWEDLKNSIVDKDLFQRIRQQFPDGISLKSACEQGIFMTYKDKKTKQTIKKQIRRVRCYVSATNPLKTKKHTYLSKKEHKTYYYADMGNLYAICKYEALDRGVKEYKIWSLFDISENRKNGLSDIPTEIRDKKDKCNLSLKQLVKSGDMILLFKESPDEFYEMDEVEILKRLYTVRSFENDGNRIILVHNLSAKSDTSLGRGETVRDWNNLPEKIRCGINTINFLQKNKNFTINNSGKFEFL